MSSRTAELFNQGLDFFTAILIQVEDDDWERSSPCAGWTARDLLGHLAATINLVIEIPRTVIAYAHEHLDPVPEEIIRGENRAFATKALAPADATPTEEFLAWTGRQLPSAVLRQGDFPLGRR
jgi:hypothetical protein